LENKQQLKPYNVQKRDEMRTYSAPEPPVSYVHPDT